MKRLILILFVAAGVIGFSVWRHAHPGAKPSFETEPVEQGEIQYVVTATGSTNPVVTVDVGTQVTGVVTALHADFNSEVRKGDLLAEIDPRQFHTNVEVAQASVNSAQAAVTAAQASVDVATTGISAAQADSERYQALAKGFASVEQRDKAVLDLDEESGAIVSADTVAAARAVYDAAADDTAGAVAQQQASALTVNEKRAERDVAVYQVETAKAQLVQAEASLQNAEVNLAHTRITSPIDGIVLLREVSVGETVVASAQVPVLFQIAQDPDKVEVDVDLDESDISRVQTGEPATFDVDAYPGVTFRATIRQIRKDATNILGVVTYDVVMDVVNPAVQLFPGMTTNVHIVTADENEAIKVPNSALRFRLLDVPVQKPVSANGPAVVYVLDSHGKPAARKITTGISDGYYTEMVSGDLRPGDPVIVSEESASKSPWL